MSFAVFTSILGLLLLQSSPTAGQFCAVILMCLSPSKAGLLHEVTAGVYIAVLGFVSSVEVVCVIMLTLPDIKRSVYSWGCEATGWRDRV